MAGGPDVPTAAPAAFAKRLLAVVLILTSALVTSFTSARRRRDSLRRLVSVRPFRGQARSRIVTSRRTGAPSTRRLFCRAPGQRRWEERFMTVTDERWRSYWADKTTAQY